MLGFASLGYGVLRRALGSIFIWYSIGVWRMPEGDEKMVPAKKLFAYSIFYLFAIFSALMIDHLIATLWLTAGGCLMELVTLTDAQKKSRRGRNVALGLVLFGLVAIFYVVTLIKFSNGMVSKERAWHRSKRQSRKERAQRRIVASCLAFVFGMVGMAMPPCRSTTCSARSPAITARPSASSRRPTSFSTRRSR
jgi:hypothetical protein